MSDTGGRRAGAGRPLGAATKKTREIANAAAASGITPLEYMIGVMRDASTDLAVRLDAAKSAAPYIHPRLSSVDLGNKDDKAFKHKVYGWADKPDQAIPDPSREE